MDRITPDGPENATATMAEQRGPLAPELAVSQWFNTQKPLTLAALRGRPVFLHSFQLLCPGCVSDAIPQLKRIERVFGHTDLQIIGIHTVFEHHAAMMPVTLKAFLHEYRITTPIAVDTADETSGIPITMRRFGMRGTPSSVLIGRDGTILHHTFGVEDDLALGARLAMALSASIAEHIGNRNDVNDSTCADGRCEVPEAKGAAW